MCCVGLSALRISLRKILSVCGRGFGRENLQGNPGGFFLEEIPLVYGFFLEEIPLVYGFFLEEIPLVYGYLNVRHLRESIG
jgi:hypothetical protein